MRGAVRLAAVMGAPAIYVWTHDSIGLGEDGPTHQPVEHLAALRAIPGLAIVRPGGRQRDRLRLAGHPGQAVGVRSGPVGSGADPAERADPGGHLRRGRRPRRPTSWPRPTATCRSSCSAADRRCRSRSKARELLQAEGIGTRVVSVPCLDWFEAQDSAYIESVLPAAVTARVSVEAGVAQPWWRWLGTRRPPGVPRALRRLGRRRHPVPRVRLHPRARRGRRPRIPGRGRQAGRRYRTASNPDVLAHVGSDTGTAHEGGTAND